MPSKISPRLKLERAYKHILELNQRWAQFYDSHPYRVAIKDHAYIYERSWILSDIADVPEDFPVIVGDILQNLRSALDHLVVLAIANQTGNLPAKKFTSFPIGKDSTEFPPPTFGGRVVGLGQKGEQIIERVKAYKGGNEVLWRLHSLNNFDKHNLVVVAANALVAHTVPKSVEEQVIAGFKASNPTAEHVPDLRGALIAPTNISFPLQKGCQLLRLPVSELKDDMQFTFDIAFDQPGKDFHGTGVFSTVQTAFSAVLNVIEQFERAGLV